MVKQIGVSYLTCFSPSATPVGCLLLVFKGFGSFLPLATLLLQLFHSGCQLRFSFSSFFIQFHLNRARPPFPMAELVLITAITMVDYIYIYVYIYIYRGMLQTNQLMVKIWYRVTVYIGCRLLHSHSSHGNPNILGICHANCWQSPNITYHLVI